MWKDIDIAGKILFGFIISALVFAFVGLSFFTFSSKKFAGYYLSAGNGIPAVIKINWENAPDETAYINSDPNKVLEVYEKLRAQKTLIPIDNNI